MDFGNLETLDGLIALNACLSDKSYIAGYRPSQDDIVVFEAIKIPPPAELINVLRWYNHIASFNDEERRKFQGSVQPIKDYRDQYNQEKHELKTRCITPTEITVSNEAQNDDDGFDLFGDDDTEKSRQPTITSGGRQSGIRVTEEPKEIAKSRIILDVKPWDDEVDMKELEQLVRSIQMDGLIMGASQLMPVVFPIKKLQITCIVEDEKVSVTDLEEKITEFENHVQSVDVAWFEKI